MKSRRGQGIPRHIDTLAEAAPADSATAPAAIISVLVTAFSIFVLCYWTVASDCLTRTVADSSPAELPSRATATCAGWKRLALNKTCHFETHLNHLRLLDGEFRGRTFASPGILAVGRVSSDY
jgi:hypothetical protein